MSINRLPKVPNRPKIPREQQARELAEILHGKKCRWNHTDGCSWHYTNWDTPCSTRQKYLKDAYDMLAEFDNDMYVIKKVLKHI